jgi:predicted nucleic acid-binding protein
VPRRALLLDTSFIIALENRDDPFHARAKGLDRELSREDAVVYVHWGVLLEIGDGYARLNRREKGSQLLDKIHQEEGYRVVPLTEDLIQLAMALYRSRHDKEWGLTDCLSFVLMEREGITQALSADVHFRQAGFDAVLLD